MGCSIVRKLLIPAIICGASVIQVQAKGVVPYFYQPPAAGSDEQVQFNDQGIATGADLLFNSVDSVAGVGATDPLYLFNIDGTVEADFFLGPDGPIGVSTDSLWNSIYDPTSAYPFTDLVAGVDVAIQSNLCVGLDCVSGVVFNDDTYILRENNLRFFFDDTSSEQASDWRIEGNDSANGGANYLAFIEVAPTASVPFRITAPAASNSMVVKAANGNVGIKRGVPLSAVHVTGYAQMATITGVPPAEDCDSDNERGRIVMDNSDATLWVCVDSGWIAK